MATAKKKQGASNKSVQADAARKTKEGLKYAMEDLVEGEKQRKSMAPDTRFAPQVLKRLAQNKKFVYENRMAYNDPSTVKVKKAVKKNK
jgi:hypothetical protein